MARIAELLRSPRRRSSHRTMSGKDWRKGMFEDVDGRRAETGMIDWMSDGNELQRSDAATGNVRRPPTVVSRNGGTSSRCDDDERSRRRPGRSATRTRSFTYGGARPCSAHAVVHSRHGTGSLGHRVNGSFGSSFTSGSPGHRVIILKRRETRVFPVFEKMPKMQNVHLKC